MMNSSAAAYTDGQKITVKCRSAGLLHLASAPETLDSIRGVFSEVLEHSFGPGDLIFEQGTEEETRPETDSLADILNNEIH